MEQFSAKEKDKVLNQIELLSFIRLRELDGNIDYNRLIIPLLEKDGYITVERMTNDDRSRIFLTSDGESFKNLGGYLRLAKKEQNEKWKRRTWNALCYLLGVITGAVGQYVLFLLTQTK